MSLCWVFVYLLVGNVDLFSELQGVMNRDVSGLINRDFDVVIIGGGIHGAAAALQLADSGLKTVLLEKSDFSHATSANSLKILHGGLRYLQHLDFRRMRESILSRRAFMKIAPHLVQPLSCIMPTYGRGLQGRFVMGVALFLNDIISFDRNKGVRESIRLRPGKLLSRTQCLEIAPGVKKSGLTGAALWHDALITDTERMVLTLLKKAVEKGACVANYVKVEGLIEKGKVVSGVAAYDLVTGTKLEIGSRLVVNASGPWLDEMVSFSKEKENSYYAKAVNIIFNRRLFSNFAVGLAGSSGFVDKDAVIKRGKRLFFFVPWRGKTIVGTTYKHHSGTKDRLEVTRGEQLELIREVNAIYPDANFDIDDVCFSHAGLVPALETSISYADPQVEKHSELIDHEKEHGLKGLVSIKGVKYTTAIDVADKLLKLIAAKQIFSIIPDQNRGMNEDSVSLSPAVIDSNDVSLFLKQYPHIETSYGDEAKELYRVVQDNGGADTLINQDPPLLSAEIIYAVREEMALKLADVVFRRTGIGSAQFPGIEVLEKIADIMADLLSWSEEKRKDEVDQVVKKYQKDLAVKA